MLQIRLSRIPAAEGGSGAKPLPADSVTVACPDHLVLADLPVAKAIGSATAASLVKSVGRRSRRQLGERVHFCVRCDYPIAIYGRLSPCEHAFCLDCARSVSICYLCDERIQKIQTVKMMEGIFICAAPHCLKSFMKRTEFEFHIHENHADLLQPNPEKDEGNESEAQSNKQSTASDSTVRGPLRQVFSPGSNTQHLDREDKAQRQQSRDQSWPATLPKQYTSFGQPQHNLSDSLPDDSQPQTLDRLDSQNRFLQQNYDTQGPSYQETGLLPDKQQGILPEPPFSEYPPMHTIQPPSFVVPMTSNLMMTSPLPYGYPPFPTEGSQQFYSAPYEVARQDSAALQVGSEQGSLLGFPPSVGTSFSGSYQQPWNGVKGIPFESSSGGQGISDGLDDSQVKGGFYPAEYGRHPGSLPLNASTLPLASKGLEPVQSGNGMDPRDGKGILAPQPIPFSSRAQPPQPQSSQHMRGKFYLGEMGHDGQGFGWQHENNDNFGGGLD